MTAHLLAALASTMPWKRTRPAASTRHVAKAGRRRLALAGAVAAAATLASTVAATPAQAYEYRHGGVTGNSNSSHIGKCKQTSYRALVVTGTPPVVTGANLRAGKADYTFVRYRAFLVNANNGAAIEQSGWSAWITAADTAATTWAGTTSFNGSLVGNYAIDYRIEWWNSTRQIGWEAHRVGKYNYYNTFNMGPYGPFSSCARLG